MSNASIVASQLAIRDFLQKVNVHFPQYGRDAELELRVKEIVRHWGDEGALRPYVITALILTVTAYAHVADPETRVLITLFTTLIIAMDDPAVFGALTPGEFHRKMCAGVVQRERGLLAEFAQVLQRVWEHYPAFSANTIYASALRFVNASVMENEWRGAAFGPDARPFIEYKRSMTATTEAYACFIWPAAQFPDYRAYAQAIPDTMLYVSYVNDILSFYKEELAGEEDNYIHERALATGEPASAALQGVITDTIAAVNRVRDILGEGGARDAWENFAAGYIRVHTDNPRYRLKDVLGCEYIIDDSSY